LTELLKLLKRLDFGSLEFLRDFIDSTKDHVIYVHYQLEDIDSILAYLVEQDYRIHDEIWNKHDHSSHLLIDHTMKVVQMIKGTWLDVVIELHIPIYTIENYQDILDFHQ
jgi:hypothetical protein